MGLARFFFGFIPYDIASSLVESPSFRQSPDFVNNFVPSIDKFVLTN